MPIPNQINNSINTNSEHSVYFYPGKVKICYSSLEDFKYNLAKIFSLDLRLEEKLRKANEFIDNIIKVLINQGTFKEDHTLVVTDLVLDRQKFKEAIQSSLETTINNKVKYTKLSQSQIYKRQILVALFIKKEKPLKDLITLLRQQGKINIKFLNNTVNLQQQKAIKFRPTKELEDYIITFLTRKALLSQGCSIYLLRKYIYMIIEIVIWYSRCLAYINNEHEVTPEMLSKAITIVDQFYITDTRFIKMLQGSLASYIISLLS